MHWFLLLVHEGWSGLCHLLIVCARRSAVRVVTCVFRFSPSRERALMPCLPAQALLHLGFVAFVFIALRFRHPCGFVVSFSYRCSCDSLCSSIISHGAPTMSSVILHSAPIMIRVSIFIPHPNFCFRFRIGRPVSLYGIPGQRTVSF